MLRRSTRLVSISYYNSDGVPVISYKETTYRIFKKRRLCQHPQPHLPPDTAPDAAHDTDYTSSSSSSRGRPRVTVKTFGLLVFMLLWHFGLIFLWSGLDSGFPTTIINKVCCTDSEEVGKQLRELRDELVKVKEKIDFLFPLADRVSNFALESLGAKILHERSSESYPPEEPALKSFGFTILSAKKKPPVNPRIVIQGQAPMVPGQCWAFAGSQGHLTVALSHNIITSHVTLGHIPKMVSPNENIFSAPKMFSVFGKKNSEDADVHLGTFQYDQNGDPLQTFRIPDHKRDVIGYVTLQVRSNWGNPEYSCLYSFRVHGKMADYA